VARGQEIAESGRTAILPTRSEYDYPHLHFEVRCGGVAVDPGRYFPGIVPEEAA
jgi:murein DD-endopeptidase MepM/ murein hydrolase activator NlpD